MEEDTFAIQMEFSNPILVSASSQEDQLEIRFLERWVFNGSENTNTIYQGKLVSSAIPPQISQSLFDSLNSVGASSSSGISSLLVGNFVLNILMSSSMSALWGMINSLQILIHLPIFSIPIPLNARLFYAAIIAVTQFDVLPTDTINKWLFEFEDSEEEQNENFKNMDIF